MTKASLVRELAALERLTDRVDRVVCAPREELEDIARQVQLVLRRECAELRRELAIAEDLADRRALSVGDIHRIIAEHALNDVDAL